jgi:hypothetical protein
VYERIWGLSRQHAEGKEEQRAGYSALGTRAVYYDITV